MLFNKAIALRVVKPLDLTGYSRHETNPPNDSAKRARELLGSFRADQLMLVSRRRFEGALHGNTTNKNCMAESAHRAIRHADTYGGKTELLITVKLADRKLERSLKTPYSGTRAHTKRKLSGLSSNKIGGKSPRSDHRTFVSRALFTDFCLDHTSGGGLRQTLRPRCGRYRRRHFFFQGLAEDLAHV